MKGHEILFVVLFTFLNAVRIYDEVVNVRTIFDEDVLRSLKFPLPAFGENFRDFRDVRGMIREANTVQDLAKKTVDAILSNRSSHGLYKLYSMFKYGRVRLEGELGPLDWSVAEPESIRRAFEILDNIKAIPEPTPDFRMVLKVCKDEPGCKYVKALLKFKKEPAEVQPPAVPGTMIDIRKLSTILGGPLESPEKPQEEYGSIMDNAIYVAVKIKKIMEDDSSFVHRAFAMDELEDVVNGYLKMNELVTLLKTNSAAMPIKEYMVLDMLRKDDFVKLLVPIQLEKDAMLVQLRKVGEEMFDVEFYCPGIGRAVLVPTGLKSVPYRKFVGIPLSVLRRRFFLRRLIETVLLNNDSFQMKPKKNILFDLLSILSDYEHVPDEDEVKTIGLVPFKRLADTSFTAIEAHLKTRFNRKYRCLKIAIIHEMLNDVSMGLRQALGIEKAPADAIPVDNALYFSKRDQTLLIVLYAFENHARSVLAFLKHDNGNLLPANEAVVSNVSEICDADFWKQYGKWKEMDKAAKKNDSAIPSYDAKFGIDTYPDVFRELRDKRIENEVRFEMALSSSTAHQGGYTARQPTAGRYVLEQLTKANFESKMDHLLYSDKLTNEICYNWPIPSAGKDIYEDLVGVGKGGVPYIYDEEWNMLNDPTRLDSHAYNMERVFNGLRQMLSQKSTGILQTLSVKSCLALMKLYLIFHRAFVRECPEIATLRVLKEPLRHYLASLQMDAEPDWEIWRQLYAINDILEESKDYPASVFDNGIVKDYVTKFLPKSLDHDDGTCVPAKKFAPWDFIPRNSLLGRRVGSEIPAAYYYWRDALYIVRHLMKVDVREKVFEASYYFSYWDPECSEPFGSGLTHMLFGVENTLPTSKRPEDTINKFCLAVSPVVSKWEQPYRSQSPDFLDPFAHKSWKSYQLNLAEWGMYNNVLFKQPSMLDVYHQLVYEEHENMDWASILHLGIKAIAHDQRAVEVDTALLQCIASLIQKLCEDLAEQVAVDQLSLHIPNRMRKVGALIVVQAMLATKLGAGQDQLADNQEAIHGLVDGGILPKTDLVYLTMGFLLSFSRATFTSDNIHMYFHVLHHHHGLETDSLSLVTRKQLLPIIQQNTEYAAQLLYSLKDMAVLRGVLRRTAKSDEDMDMFDNYEFGTEAIKVNLLTGEKFVNGFKEGVSYDEVAAQITRVEPSNKITSDHVKKIQISNKYGERVVVIDFRDDLDEPLFGSDKVITREYGQQRKLKRLVILQNSAGDTVNRMMREYECGVAEYLHIGDDFDSVLLHHPVPEEGPSTVWLGNYMTISRPTCSVLVDLSSKYYKGTINYVELGLKNCEMATNYGKPAFDEDTLILVNAEYNILYMRSFLLNQKIPLVFVANQKLGGWKLWPDMEYEIDADQGFQYDSSLPPVLVLQRDMQGKMERYALVPFKQINEAPANSGMGALFGQPQKKVSDAGKTAINVEQIPIDSSGKLQATDRKQNLLLAYLYLNGKEYHEAFDELRKVHQMEAFSEAENEIVAWLAEYQSRSNDHSPSASAVLAYLLYTVFANDRLFDRKRELTETEASHRNAIMDGYFAFRTKIPRGLRFDFHSGRRIVDEEEEELFLSTFSLYRSNLEENLKVAIPKPMMDVDFNPGGIYLPKLYSLEDITAKDVGAFYEGHKPSDFPTPMSLGNLLEKLVFLHVDHFQMGEVDEYGEGLQRTSDYRLGAALKTAVDIKNSPELRARPTETRVPYDAPWYEHFRDFMKTVADALWVTYRLQPLLDMEPKFEGKLTPHQPLDVRGEAFKAKQSRRLEKLLACSPIETPLIEDGDMPDEFQLLAMRTWKVGDVDADWLDDKIAAFEGAVQASRAGITDFLANHGQDVPNLVHRIQEIAKGLQALSDQDLVVLYTSKCLQDYYRMLPWINEEGIKALHALITRYMYLSTNLNDLRRIRAVVGDPIQLETELSRQPLYTTQDNIPVAYELFLKSRVNGQQKAMVSSFLEKEEGSNIYKSQIDQVIMSGGKTVVSGTMLCMMRSDGFNLPIAIVPRALQTSEATNIFGRSVQALRHYGFSFSVTRSSSFENLEWIYLTMQKAIKNHQYLILSPEKIQTLLLVFAEQLEIDSQSRIVGVLKKILALVQTHGAALFDEIDLCFDPKNELNFSHGKRIEPSTRLVYQSLMMTEVFYAMMQEELPFDIRTNTAVSEGDYRTLVAELAEMTAARLVAKDLPLMQLLLGPTYSAVGLPGIAQDKAKAALAAFFATSDQDMEEEEARSRQSQITALLQAICPEDEMDLLLALRRTIQDFVLFAWQVNYNENFGPSPEEKCHYAIPYVGLHTPKVGSEFVMRWITYARTIRMHIMGELLPKNVAKMHEWAVGWVEEHCVVDKSKKKTPFEVLVEEVFGKHYRQITTSSPHQLKQLTAEMRRKFHDEDDSLMRLRLLWVAVDIIPHIPAFLRQYTSCNQDSLLAFNSHSGYSGTINSTKSFDPFFHDLTNVNVDTTVDTRIHDIIKRLKPRVVTVEDGLKAGDLMEDNTLLDAIEELRRQNSTLGALIDPGCYFRDEGNQQVAEALMKTSYTREPIRAVIFFDSALNKPAVLKSDSTKHILNTTSRAEIARRTAEPQCRITYYDQPHTTGVDVFQDDQAMAIVFVGVRTTLRDLFQAILRMRKFLVATQPIIFVVPHSLMKAMGKDPAKDTVQVKDIMKYCLKALIRYVRDSNVASMDHILRRICRQVALREALKLSAPKGCTDLWMKDSEVTLESLDLPRLPTPIRDFFERRFDLHLDQLKACYGQEARDEAYAVGKAILDKALAFSEKTAELIAELKTLNDDTIDEDKVRNIQAKLDNLRGTHKIIESQLTRPLFDLKQHNLKLRKGNLLDYMETLLEYPITIRSGQVSDKDQQVDTDVDVDVNLNLFQDNQNEIHGAAAPVGEVRFNIPFSNPVLPICNLAQDYTKVGCAVGLQDYLDSSELFGLMGGWFSKDLYLSSRFKKILFGKSRRYPFYVLALAKPEETRMVVLSIDEGIELKEKYAERSTLFGYDAWVTTPFGLDLKALGNKEAFPLERFRPLLTQVLVFAGYSYELRKPEWQHSLQDWLGADEAMAHVKKSVFKGIIITPKEALDLLPVTDVALFQSDAAVDQWLAHSIEFNILHLLSENTKEFGTLLDHMRKTGLGTLAYLHVLLKEAQLDATLGIDGVSRGRDLAKFVVYLLRTPKIDGSEYALLRLLFQKGYGPEMIKSVPKVMKKGMDASNTTSRAVLRACLLEFLKPGDYSSIGNQLPAGLPRTEQVFTGSVVFPSVDWSRYELDKAKLNFEHSRIFSALRSKSPENLPSLFIGSAELDELSEKLLALGVSRELAEEFGIHFPEAAGKTDDGDAELPAHGSVWLTILKILAILVIFTAIALGVLVYLGKIAVPPRLLSIYASLTHSRSPPQVEPVADQHV